MDVFSDGLFGSLGLNDDESCDDAPFVFPGESPVTVMVSHFGDVFSTVALPFEIVFDVVELTVVLRSSRAMPGGEVWSDLREGRGE